MNEPEQQMYEQYEGGDLLEEYGEYAAGQVEDGPHGEDGEDGEDEEGGRHPGPAGAGGPEDDDEDDEDDDEPEAAHDPGGYTHAEPVDAEDEAEYAAHAANVPARINEDLTRVDWEGLELVDQRFVGCHFDEAQMLELVTRRCVFENCSFGGVRLSSSEHHESAFLHCRFHRVELFGSVFHGCKMTGSTFTESTLQPLTIEGGDWSYVSLRGADLHQLDFTGVRLREADFTDADLRGAVLRGADLGYARMSGANVFGADLTGAETEGLDWLAFDVQGIRLGLEQALTFAAAHGIRID